MPSKRVSTLVLIGAVLVDAVLLLTAPDPPSYRLLLGLVLLVPIILAASSGEVAKKLRDWLGMRHKLRRYPALRSKVDAFLSEVRRLNWLVADADHGFGDKEAVTTDIEECKKRMEVLFGEIVEAAGHASIGLEEGEGEEPAPEEAVEDREEPGESPDEEEIQEPEERE